MLVSASRMPVRSVNDSAEYRRNYLSAEYVNALAALDGGFTGKGVTVAVIDDGVDVAHSEFAGQISPLSKDFGFETRNGVKTARDNLGTDGLAPHGTSVAAIIAGKRDGIGTHGIAPDAQIAVLRVSDYDHDTEEEALVHADSALLYAALSGIKIVNMSLSGDGSDGVRAVMDVFATSGSLLIQSAGNDAEPNPEDAAAMAPSNEKSWIFVVAMYGNEAGYHLASFSNNAGSAMHRTVAAMSGSITLRDGEYKMFAGTSASAPQVSGLAATIASKWPQLSGQEIGEVILNTARDIGAPGTDPVFGRGLIDVRAALSPINPKLSNGVGGASLENSVMAVPASVGTQWIREALGDVTVLDAYGRDFSGSLAGLVVTPEARDERWLRRRVGQMAQGGQASLAHGGLHGSVGFATYRTGPNATDTRSELTTGEVGARFGRTGIRAGFNATASLQSDIMGLAPFAEGVLAYAPQAANSLTVEHAVMDGMELGFTVSHGDLGPISATAATLALDTGRFSLRGSVIEEQGAVMGVRGTGALALGSGATSAVLEAKRRFAIGGPLGWGIDAYGSVGITRVALAPDSVVVGAGPLLGTRLGLQASGPALGGLLSFGVAQPLLVERGKVRLRLGSGYDLAARSLTFTDRMADLSGERRLQLTAGYATGGARSRFRAGVMQDVTDGTTRALAGWSLAF